MRSVGDHVLTSIGHTAAVRGSTTIPFDVPYFSCQSAPVQPLLPIQVDIMSEGRIR